MADSPHVISRVSSQTARSGANGLVVLIAFLLVALIKPWGGTDPAGGLAGPVSAAPSNGPAAEDASEPGGGLAAAPSPGPGEILCAPSGWQLVTLDRLADWTVRTWIPAAPVNASGPLDPTIPTIRLESPAVLSIGVCQSNVSESDAGTATRATLVMAAWDTSPGQFHKLDVSTTQASGSDTRLARLYTIVDARLHGAAPWPRGHFVFELGPIEEGGATPGPTDGAARWFIAVTIPGPGA